MTAWICVLAGSLIFSQLCRARRTDTIPRAHEVAALVVFGSNAQPDVHRW